MKKNPEFVQNVYSTKLDLERSLVAVALLEPVRSQSPKVLEIHNFKEVLGTGFFGTIGEKFYEIRGGKILGN